MSTIRVALSSLSSFEIVVGPSAGGRWGMRWANDSRSHRRISVSHAATEGRAELLSVGFSTRSRKKLSAGLASDGRLPNERKILGPSLDNPWKRDHR